MKDKSETALAKYAISPKRVAKLLARYRVEDGHSFRLKHHDPGDTGDQKFNKEEAHALLVGGVEALSEHQERLYAQDQWAAAARASRRWTRPARTARSSTSCRA